MDPSAWTINADDGVASTVIPGWAADTGGVTLRITARVVIRLLQRDQDIEPQLISHFCRRTVSSSDHFTIPLPYRQINLHPTWEEQTRRMFSYVAANHVRPADLHLLARAFRRYTYAVRDRFPIAGLQVAVMEFFSVVEIPVAPSASASQLRYSVPGETYEYFFGGGGNVDDDAQYSRGPRPASTAAMEGLQTVNTMGEDSSCSICLDHFEVMTQVLAMPCGHSFHEGCLKEWLQRSNSCPLCRFSLPAAE